jgi:ketosteroid isomerase-like protein
VKHPWWISALLCVVSVSASAGPATQAADGEKKVWALEQAYWSYVKANDMDQHLTLWRDDFLGWPLSSPEPVGKRHITDWITAHTSAGERLGSYELERLASQASGSYLTITYRVRLTWAAKDGVQKPGGLRVIHTWLRDSSGAWQILSGMAAAPNGQGH